MKGFILKFIAFLISAIAILVIVEFGLRASGKYETQTEQLFGQYISIYDYADNDIYHLYPPNWTIVDSQAEFSYTFETNSIGLREKEITADSSEYTYRILTIGDSFTQGDGSPYDSTYPRFLEQMLQQTYEEFDIQVFNAGMNGSDIFYMFTLLRDKLLTYDPDLVLFLLNESEPYDVMVRGGEERFLEGDTIQVNNAPDIEPYFERYHLVRFIAREWLKMDELLLTPKKFKIANAKAIEKIHQKQDDIVGYCNSMGFKCAFVSHVSPITMRKNYPVFKHFMDSDQKDTLTEGDDLWKSTWMLFDRPDMPELNTALAEFTRDLSLDDYAWPLNEHFNGYGYQLLAQSAILELNKLDTCLLSPYCEAEQVSAN